MIARFRIRGPYDRQNLQPNTRFDLLFYPARQNGGVETRIHARMPSYNLKAFLP